MLFSLIDLPSFEDSFIDLETIFDKFETSLDKFIIKFLSLSLIATDNSSKAFEFVDLHLLDQNVLQD